MAMVFYFPLKLISRALIQQYCMHRAAMTATNFYPT